MIIIKYIKLTNKRRGDKNESIQISGNEKQITTHATT